MVVQITDTHVAVVAVAGGGATYDVAVHAPVLRYLGRHSRAVATTAAELGGGELGVEGMDVVKLLEYYAGVGARGSGVAAAGEDFEEEKVGGGVSGVKRRKGDGEGWCQK